MNSCRWLWDRVFQRVTVVFLFFAVVLVLVLLGSGVEAAAEQVEQLAPVEQFQLERILELARAGDSEAQFSLALSYEFGTIDVERDPEAAVVWFERAAEGGVSGAWLYLGLKYENGSGLTQDRAAAGRCYCRAALDGWASAHYFLAGLYRDGRGVPQDDRIARAWLSLAADLGYPSAISEMGELVELLGQQLISDSLDVERDLADKACTSLNSFPLVDP